MPTSLSAFCIFGKLTPDAILGQTSDDPVALRLTGQLMLGVTRIYGRQTQYLLDDCRETRERISAFQPGIIDLPEDQLRAPNAAITLPQLSDATMAMSAMDIYDWSSQVPIEPQGLHTAPLSRTNLRTSREYGAYNFGRPAALSIYGDSVSARSVSIDNDVTSRLDSNEFAPFDLGLDDINVLDMEGEMDVSMEMGRDRMSEGRSVTPVHQPLLPDQTMEMEHDYSALDIDMPDLPPLDASSNPNRSSSPASSALTTPPPESPPPMPVSPLTAKRLADAADAGRRVKRVRLMRPDEALELPEEAFAAPDDDAEYHVEPQFIPARDELVHLRSMASDPDHFLPSRREGGETSFFAGPSDLGPHLAELFTFPAHGLRRQRGGTAEREATPIRPAQEGELDLEHFDADLDLEIARRQSHTPGRTMTPGLDMFDMPAYDPGMTFDLEALSPAHSRYSQHSRMPSLAPSRAESIARAIQAADDGGPPLAIFDGGEASTTQLGSDLGSLSDFKSTGGFSKTTGMAMGVLRREIEAIEAEAAAEAEAGPPAEAREQRPSVQFANVARGATKRAASQFFFELLVLGGRDAVALKQDTPYGPIEVAPKPKLWEMGSGGASAEPASAA